MLRGQLPKSGGVMLWHRCYRHLCEKQEDNVCQSSHRAVYNHPHNALAQVTYQAVDAGFLGLGQLLDLVRVLHVLQPMHWTLRGRSPHHSQRHVFAVIRGLIQGQETWKLMTLTTCMLLRRPQEDRGRSNSCPRLEIVMARVSYQAGAARLLTPISLKQAQKPEAAMVGVSLSREGNREGNTAEPPGGKKPCSMGASTYGQAVCQL